MSDWGRRDAFALDGRKALVVGFANPMGRAAALALAEAGADVAVASATLDGDEIMEAKRTAKAVAKLGRASFSQGWDVTLPGNIQVGLKQLIKEFGHPTILVFNADAPLLRPITKTTDAELGRMLNVNLAGAFSSARSFVRELPEGSEDARIVYLTSLIGERGVEHAVAYAASRAGLLGIVSALSQELGDRAVTVNAIATGWMEWTDGRGPDDAEANRLLRFIPLKRFGTADDVAPLVLLLAGPGGGYLNGQVFHVDGGVGGHL